MDAIERAAWWRRWAWVTNAATKINYVEAPT